MARRPSTEQIIGEIGVIRANNNWLWMEILAVAIESEPKLMKKILKQIKENDRKVSKCLGKL